MLRWVEDRASSGMPGLRSGKRKEHYLFSLFDRPGSKVIHPAAKQDGWHITATGRQAQPYASQTLQPFGTRCHVPPCIWLPRCFGRIAPSVKPYSVSLPLSTISPRGATRHGTERGSRVSYQLLRNVAPLSPQSLSLPAPRRFPQPDVP